MRECAVNIPHIRQMPLPKGMLLGSNPLQNPNLHNSDKYVTELQTYLY